MGYNYMEMVAKKVCDYYYNNLVFKVESFVVVVALKRAVWG